MNLENSIGKKIKVTVGEISSETRTTKFGDKQQYIIKTPTGNVFESMVGKWNGHWAQGMIVEGVLDVFNGKAGKIFKLKAPEEFRRPDNAMSGGGGLDKADLVEINRKLDAILDGLKTLATTEAPSTPDVQDDVDTF